MSGLDAVRGFVRFAAFPAGARARISWSVGYALVCTTFVLARIQTPPYDDSHFFKRISQNGISHGALAWNVDEGPVHGVTSQLYQLVNLLIVALTPAHSMLAARGVAAACLIACYSLLRSLTQPHDRGFSPTAACLAPALLSVLLSGMETALCLLVVSLSLVAAVRPSKHWAIAPLLVLLVYLTRPDAALLVVAPLLFLRPDTNRRTVYKQLFLVAALLGMTLALFRFYYGTALPLPFYAKQSLVSPYDAEFVAMARKTAYERFGAFAQVGLPLVLLSLARRDRQNLILLGSALGFVAYHWFSTIDVMGMHGRFYVPAQPLLAVSAARGGEVLAAKISALARLWGPMAALLLALVGGSSALRLHLYRLEIPSDEDYLARQTRATTVHRGLDTLRSCFGERLHAYHSELGLLGLRLQEGKVTDLAGLMSERWAFRAPGTFDEFCERDRPEAIFLPHKNYSGLNREIQASRCLKAYELVVAQSSSPLYVRRDLAAPFHACALERRDAFVVPARAKPN